MGSFVGYFRRRAPLWMFDSVLNETLPNKEVKLPSLGLYKGILDFPCLLILLIFTKHKSKRWNLGLSPRLYFTSLKLCKYFQIQHPSPKVASIPKRIKSITIDLTIYKYSSLLNYCRGEGVGFRLHFLEIFTHYSL